MPVYHSSSSVSIPRTHLWTPSTDLIVIELTLKIMCTLRIFVLLRVEMKRNCGYFSRK